MSELTSMKADVVVVGAGNAALSAALSAKQSGAGRVVVLERAPVADRGGNSAYSGGSMRFPYHGVDDVLRVVPDLSETEIKDNVWGEYTKADYYTDIARVTQSRADPELAEVLVENAFDTVAWFSDLGVRFVPTYGRYAHKVDGRIVFFGGPVAEAVGGGAGLMDSLFRAAEDAGIEIHYGTRARRLLRDVSIRGVVVEQQGREFTIESPAVVLASGGFQANAEWRTRYLGPGWDLAKVRGTRFNTGDGIQMAMDVGAMPFGHWSGCHAVGWDLNAPAFGDVSVGDGFNKHGYPFGIMVNTNGERFVDEGADYRHKTYAKYGKVILGQPGQFAWQIFDAKIVHLLQPEFYRIRRATRVKADTIEGLISRLDDIDSQRCLETVHAYNASIPEGRTIQDLNPTEKDGLSTEGLEIPKSNWALRIDTPPFEAYAVTCGITWTFGGIRANARAEVVDMEERPIDGLYTCGEMVGGMWYFNYPGSAGLTWGATFGRVAGRHAAAYATEHAAT